MAGCNIHVSFNAGIIMLRGVHVYINGRQRFNHCWSRVNAGPGRRLATPYAVGIHVYNPRTNHTGNEKASRDCRELVGGFVPSRYADSVTLHVAHRLSRHEMRGINTQNQNARRNTKKKFGNECDLNQNEDTVLSVLGIPVCIFIYCMH